jgi:F-type H+-transporting ATPase subunit a
MEHGYTWFSVFGVYEPIATSVLASILLVLFALAVRRSVSDRAAAIEPEERFSVRNLGEVFVDAISGLAEGAIGHGYEKYVPLLASLFSFILVANLLGLIPGFVPPTGKFQVTFALGLVSFFAYHAYGMKEQGFVGYWKHFLGPVLLIAPLMLVIELFSHAFRPVSLGIRLFANMDADHRVLATFTELTRFGVPVVFYVLGAFVSVIQAFIFTILTAIYISMAVAHDH